MDRDHLKELKAIAIFYFRGANDPKCFLQNCRDYKIPDGKPANSFGFDSQPQSQALAKKVIVETHGFYNDMHAQAS